MAYKTPKQTPGKGAPAIYPGQRMKPTTVTLPEDLLVFAKSLSPDGSLSAGLRIGLLRLSILDPEVPMIPESERHIRRELRR